MWPDNRVRINRFRLLIMDKQDEVGSECDFMSWDLSHIFSSSSKPFIRGYYHLRLMNLQVNIQSTIY